MNTAGIQHAAMRSAWPVFSVKTHKPIDLTSDEPVDEIFVAEWLADVLRGDDDEDESTATISGVACVRVALEEPLTPSQIFELLVAFYSADHWYDLIVSDGVRTTPSILLALPAGQPFSAVHAEIDAAIGQLGGRVFARMDHASSKTITACTTSAEVEANLRCSERTAARLRGIEAGKAVDGPANGFVMLRRWVEDLATTHVEMRVFVHGGEARGLSMTVGEHCKLHDSDEQSCVACLRLLKRAVRTFAKRCVVATEYQDCVLDVAVPVAALDAAQDSSALLASLWLIECNTPVYMAATSGRFDLSNEAHRTILCGERPQEIDYPVLLAEFEWRTSMVELFT